MPRSVSIVRVVIAVRMPKAFDLELVSYHAGALNSVLRAGSSSAGLPWQLYLAILTMTSPDDDGRQ